jgi:PhnB protein
MLADPTPEFGAMPSSIYLYVPDCDTVYQRALDCGGVSVFPMMTLPSGERYGGVKDPCGNIWWVATHIEDVPIEEQERRWNGFKMPTRETSEKWSRGIREMLLPPLFSTPAISRETP